MNRVPSREAQEAKNLAAQEQQRSDEQIARRQAAPLNEILLFWGGGKM